MSSNKLNSTVEMIFFMLVSTQVKFFNVARYDESIDYNQIKANVVKLKF